LRPNLPQRQLPRRQPQQDHLPPYHHRHYAPARLSQGLRTAFKIRQASRLVAAIAWLMLSQSRGHPPSQRSGRLEWWRRSHEEDRASPSRCRFFLPRACARLLASRRWWGKRRAGRSRLSKAAARDPHQARGSPSCSSRSRKPSAWSCHPLSLSGRRIISPRMTSAAIVTTVTTKAICALPHARPHVKDKAGILINC
jgi:hypothetical protein